MQWTIKVKKTGNMAVIEKCNDAEDDDDDVENVAADDEYFDAVDAGRDSIFAPARDANISIFLGRLADTLSLDAPDAWLFT